MKSTPLIDEIVGSGAQKLITNQQQKHKGHMKKTPLILSEIVTLMLTAVLIAGPQPTKDKGSHLGTWQLVSTKYGDEKEFSDAPKDEQKLKMRNETHFIWVAYDAKTKLISSSM